MTSLAYVVKHPDGTACPEYSYPSQGGCPLVGLGIHKDLRYLPSAVTTDEDILDHFIGPVDVQHLVETGEKRRIAQVLEPVEQSRFADLVAAMPKRSPYFERLMDIAKQYDEVDILGPINLDDPAVAKQWAVAFGNALKALTPEPLDIAKCCPVHCSDWCLNKDQHTDRICCTED